MESDSHPRRLLECAVAAAQAAGGHAQRNFRRRRDAIRNTAHDVKLRLDLECQERAEAVIRAACPDHAILGEERLRGRREREAASEYQWIIDPIDGTVNFSHGLPMWCSAVAVRRGEETLAGAVYAPQLGELYTATAGGPALVNGSRIRVSDIGRLAKSIVFTGVDRRGNIPPLELLRSIALRVQRARVTGSAALDICRVARGQGEGYFEVGIFLWDMAAAALIVDRAGGRTEILERRPNHGVSFLATNGLVHAALRRLVRAGVKGWNSRGRRPRPCRPAARRPRS
jgi:myo-inositol-1(or 4)-monophosphatase